MKVTRCVQSTSVCTLGSLWKSTEMPMFILMQICTRKSNGHLWQNMPLGKSLPLWFGKAPNPASGKGLSFTPNRRCTVWPWLLGSNHYGERLFMPSGVAASRGCFFWYDVPMTWSSFTNPVVCSETMTEIQLKSVIDS